MEVTGQDLRHPDPSASISVNKACGNCARAKAKCISGHEIGGKCESRVSKSHVEKLGEKLDGLVTLLQATRQLEPLEDVTVPARNIGTPPIPIRQPASQHISISGVTTSINSNCHQVQDLPSGLCSSLNVSNIQNTGSELHSGGQQVTPTMSSASFADGFQMDEGKADALLQIFLNEMSPNFPFIFLDGSTRSIHLRQERPILHLAILAVSTRDTTQQQELGEMLVANIVERVYIKNERTMDLLLGSMTYAAWYYYHFQSVPRLTSMISTTNVLMRCFELLKNKELS
ncbi:hypothetical protein G7Y89_g3094 [Cudoniella acicularis]|uniref:Zn(2)-C6 fungal-type domain-containing protein n=1 Tax=Cudoniella acicularis TaxID=354080 RepID=A0A8H4RSW7_9HELO|nr:hypothetical protein G7Y89_g3094 [Cudoniella acicularis]